MSCTIVTYRTNYTYTISGDTIQFDVVCPPNASCIRPPKGVLVDMHLLLDMSGGDNAVVYDYLHFLED
jgi:hypothetical protein